MTAKRPSRDRRGSSHHTERAAREVPRRWFISPCSHLGPGEGARLRHPNRHELPGGKAAGVRPKSKLKTAGAFQTGRSISNASPNVNDPG